MTTTITFHPFQEAHLDGALRLSREAGWPHRREDWALLLQISQGLIALEDDVVVATAIATPFGRAGMVNMIIVDQRMRGRGLGREIMNRAMDLIAPQQWRLVATKSGLPLYEKLGFVTNGSVHQHQGPVADLVAPAHVRAATPADLPAIAALDRAATGGDRTSLLDAIAALGTIAVIDGPDGIAGFACRRSFGRGEVAGPVVARTSSEAQDLLSWLMAGKAGQFMRVDTAGDADLGAWLVQNGLECVDVAVSMARGQDLADPSAFTRFALAAQALG